MTDMTVSRFPFDSSFPLYLFLFYLVRIPFLHSFLFLDPPFFLLFFFFLGLAYFGLDASARFTP